MVITKKYIVKIVQVKQFQIDNFLFFKMKNALDCLLPIKSVYTTPTNSRNGPAVAAGRASNIFGL